MILSDPWLAIGRGAVVEMAYVGNLPYRTIPYYLAFGTNFPSPYPQLSTINNSNSIYNAGQVTLRKRASGGFFYRLSYSYSYSKSIDHASQDNGASTGGFAEALDPRNLSLERSRSDWDRGHVTQASFAWPLPMGRGKRFFSNGGRVANGFAAGWQISGTAIFETSEPHREWRRDQRREQARSGLPRVQPL